LILTCQSVAAPTNDERKEDAKKKLNLLDKIVKKSGEKKKHKTKDKPNREKDFSDLLDDEELRREFQAYLVKIFCVENLFFYRDVNKFLKLDFGDQELVTKETQRLVEVYLADDEIATMPVSIDYYLKKDIEQRVAECEIVTPDLFNTAKSEIEQLLKLSFAQWKNLNK